MAAGEGVGPSQLPPKGSVLPLDDPAIMLSSKVITTLLVIIASLVVK